MQRTGTILRGKAPPFVSCLQQAYVALMLAPESKDGSRTVPLARYGIFEVRLIEFTHRAALDAFAIWIELYRRDTRSSLDSCRCEDLDDAEAAAAYLVSSARKLHELHAGSRRSASSRATPSSDSGNFFDSSL